MSAWAEELCTDFDKDFILAGVQNGFDIIDPEAKPCRVEVKNHPSASPGNPLFDLANAQVTQEIINGNYIRVDSPPVIVSPLGAIPKPDGGVRIIHDCSRPSGRSVNDYVTNTDQHRFQSVDDAAKLIKQGYYMAKVDLKSAYRSVAISKHSCQVTGLKWPVDGVFQYFYDCKLPFGSKLAPGIFHRLTQAVKRIMARRGFSNVVAYLDDFFICEATLESCAGTLSILISLLRKLGFSINWNKVVDPTKKLTFLGIEIDSNTMELRLPDDKLEALKHELAVFSSLTRVNKKQLQSLVGKLNWAASVVYGGRVFLRNLINAISSLKQDYHKVRLRANALADINWWMTFMESFNGKSVILNVKPVSAVYTDACNKAGGGHWGSNWFYINWELDWLQAADCHINEKEILSVVMAAHYWGHMWADSKVYVFSDNMTTVAGINKGTSKNSVVMTALRFLFWQSATYNFHLKAIHIPGKNNVKADVVSRLHEPFAFWSSSNPMCVPGAWTYPFQAISWKSVCYLFSRFKGPMGPTDPRFQGKFN